MKYSDIVHDLLTGTIKKLKWSDIEVDPLDGDIEEELSKIVVILLLSKQEHIEKIYRSTHSNSNFHECLNVIEESLISKIKDNYILENSTLIRKCT